MHSHSPVQSSARPLCIIFAHNVKNTGSCRYCITTGQSSISLVSRSKMQFNFDQLIKHTCLEMFLPLKNRLHWSVQAQGEGYSDLSWTGMCRSSLKTHTHL